MPSNDGASISGHARTNRVLIVGGSYAGLSAAVSLLDVCNGKRCRFAYDPEADATPSIVVPFEIIILDQRDGYYHLIGSPLAFASQDYAEKAWTTFDNIPALQNESVKVVRGSLSSIDPAKKVASYQSHGTTTTMDQPYDYLIVATGLSREYPSVPQSLDRLSYLAEIKRHITSVQQAQKGVVVIGGGAVGVEMAAELKLVDPAMKVTLVHSRDKLLSSEQLPDEFKDKTLDVLKEGGTEVILNDRVMSIKEQTDNKGGKSFELELQDGSHIQAGHVISAISRFHPTTSFLPSSAIDEEGYIKIKASLAFTDDTPNSNSHFAAGDIAKWSGIKRAGAAMHQGHLAAVNVYQQILSESKGMKLQLLELGETPPSIGLAVGSQAVTYNTFEGVKFGRDMMKLYFEDDLGYNICWNHMKLGVSA